MSDPKPKHEIKIDLTPAVEAAETARATIVQGFGALKDFTQALVPDRKWVSEDNPYRQAMLDLIEAFGNLEDQSSKDAIAHRAGREEKPKATIHSEGRSHAFRDARSLVQRYMPPELAGSLKKKGK